jgi:hypothetical protein
VATSIQGSDYLRRVRSFRNSLLPDVEELVPRSCQFIQARRRICAQATTGRSI